MAKFAQCGYGSMGQGVNPQNGEGYTYVVNDNVRVGQRLQVISTARDNKTKFVTTAVPLHTYSEKSVSGKEQKTKLNEANINTDNLTKAYSGGELGASGEITKKNIIIGDHKAQTQYTISARAKAVEKFLQTDSNAKLSKGTQETVQYAKENPPQKGTGGTFADYSKAYLKEGERL